MNKFWTEAEVARRDEVTDFQGLADIAIIVLERMRKEKRQIYQVCGPITTGGLGCPKKNRDLFQFAIAQATGMGLLVFDQMPFQDAMGRIAKQTPGERYCQAILDIFYHRVLTSGNVDVTLFLPKWYTSTGAVWEKDMAVQLEIGIDDYPIDWLRNHPLFPELVR